MANSALIESYGTFMTTAAPYTMIGNEEQYEATLNELEMALEASSDTENDPLNPLIDMLSHAIEEYEMKEIIADAIERVIRGTNFDDVDSYDADFQLDYDGRVALEGITFNQADDLADEIADSVEFLFNFSDNE